MQLTLLPTGRLRVQDPSGYTAEIGPEHPDFQRLRAQFVQYQPQPKRKTLPGRLFGLLMVAIGLGGWWYNWHLAATAGEFYIKLCILGPLGVFGGLLVTIRPDWAGPWRSNGTRARKAATIAVLGLMVVVSGIDFYLLEHGRATRSSVVPRSSVIAWNPKMGTPTATAAPLYPKFDTPAGTTAPAVAFLTATYRLASFNQRNNPMWEFVTADENINEWKTLLTIIDRPDARTRPELDRLAEGIMATYKSNGARILTAQTMRSDSGDVFNYMVAGFEEPAKQRIELNFVKMALGAKNASMVIYGVRITDTQDYRTKAREFLDRNSSEVGRALSTMSVPDISKLPRRAF